MRLPFGRTCRHGAPATASWLPWEMAWNPAIPFSSDSLRNERTMDSSTKDQLVALAHEWDRTMVENDADAIGQFMADDWVIVLSGIGGIGGAESRCDGVTRSRGARLRGDGRRALLRGVRGNLPRAALPGDREGVLRVREGGRAVALRLDPPLATSAGRSRLGQRFRAAPPATTPARAVSCQSPSRTTS
jgi:hypothetical protein